ncbi:ABC transporter C family member 13-like isoform X2 [Trifolium pratense]|uniref:ABC transporter C family member 13-like isoform X2 n=1 Tax=Trifolium pratense TaxID=57577 RepID=UPI001E69489A|nr:ABC transporter C family member 13-like isoform X2 [Trifolium pratense]XP_045807028.1 ABC transporter C family member 13-like isoform X2 [Trifolium pratense]XP_045807029.1 ABC transporter C family member 13-like isoform X2 [Trifolium pratense]
MLDDVLSSVDVQVARWILHNAILGPLMKGKTRLLCTHNTQAISSADMIVVLNKGHLKWMGSSADFPTSSYTAFSPLNEMDSTSHNQKSCSTNSSISKEQSLIDRIIMDSLEGADGVIEVELRKEGKVELGVYNGLQAATKVHNRLLSKLINAPGQFFDQTPGGRILNRTVGYCNYFILRTGIHNIFCFSYEL